MHKGLFTLVESERESDVDSLPDVFSEKTDPKAWRLGANQVKHYHWS